MNLIRLITWRDVVLAKVAPHQFSFEYWYAKSPSCGVIACPLGHASMNPNFKAEGLHLEQDKGDCIPMYGTQRGYAAGAYFFGLSEDETRWVACAQGYDNGLGQHQFVTIPQVQQRITTLLKREKHSAVEKATQTVRVRFAEILEEGKLDSLVA